MNKELTAKTRKKDIPPRTERCRGAGWVCVCGGGGGGVCGGGGLGCLWGRELGGVCVCVWGGGGVGASKREG